MPIHWRVPAGLRGGAGSAGSSASRRGHRHGQPQQRVGHDADDGGRQHDERHAHDQRVLPQVRGGPDGDAGQQPPAAGAPAAAARRGRGGAGQVVTLRSSHRATPGRHR